MKKFQPKHFFQPTNIDSFCFLTLFCSTSLRKRFSIIESITLKSNWFIIITALVASWFAFSCVYKVDKIMQPKNFLYLCVCVCWTHTHTQFPWVMELINLGKCGKWGKNTTTIISSIDDNNMNRNGCTMNAFWALTWTAAKYIDSFALIKLTLVVSACVYVCLCYLKRKKEVIMLCKIREKKR